MSPTSPIPAVPHTPALPEIFGDGAAFPKDNLVVTVHKPPNVGARRERQASLSRMYDLFPRLRERRSQLAGTFSGGLLMLDEPSLGLAPLIVANIFSIIKEINAQGMTILLVEQNIVHSLKMSHQAFVIENGRIVLSGTGEALLKNERTKEAYFGTYQEEKRQESS